MKTTPLIDHLEAIARAPRRAVAQTRQSDRRRRESLARRQAVCVFEELRARGRRCRQLADALGVVPRTLAQWRRRHRTAPATPWRAWRGRPVKESSWLERHAVLEVLDDFGPRVGLPTLRSLFPDLARSELIELQKAYRAYYRNTHRISQERLKWTSPGRVWAIDHSVPPRPIDGAYPAILAVRDLASGSQLAWLPVPAEQARSTAVVLTTLFAEHGPPLVLKSDNGSAFRSELVQELLDRHRVVWLPSPVRMPRYNGSCEAGIGSMKVRTLFLAAAASRVGTWSSDDLETARRQANALTRPDDSTGPVPDDAWCARSPIADAERTQFRLAVDRHRATIDQQHSALDTISYLVHRQAVRRALVELGLLSITRRSITLPLRYLKMAKIR
jgi:transposase InsO family protein